MGKINNVYDVKIKYLSEEAKKFGVPTYGYWNDSGCDLYVVLPEDSRKTGLVVYPHERVLLSADISIQLPDNIWGLITHRSSTEKRLRLRIIGGVIDPGWRGNLFAHVSNENTFPITVQHGDRVAQLILLPVTQANFIVVDELDPSDRGVKGFGSTGHGSI